MNSESQVEDHRRCTRVSFQSPVHVSSDVGEWDCELVDISLSGALIAPALPVGLQAGARLTLDLPLGERGVVLSMQGLVTRVDGRNLGFMWEDIGLDSFIHLRRLIELNLGDGEQVSRELKQLRRRSR